MKQSSLSLKGRALRYLAAREHSRAELERKLAPHAAALDDPSELSRVLDELADKGFISEQRVAESVLRHRAGKLGGARVLQELRAKGLGEQALCDAAGQLRATELERARAVWARKFGTPPQNPSEQARQMRFLAARGFAFETARKVLGAE
ncbi:MAG: recombination regulator RecX [Burkholderiaceae bacterium]|nr:recombination regulator RecX [Burkholderiaceae bacterium]